MIKLTQVLKDLHCPKCNSTVITRTETIVTVHKTSIIEIDGEPELELKLVDTDHEDDVVYQCTSCEFKSDDVTDFGFPKDK